jgi:hypothetical protein
VVDAAKTMGLKIPFVSKRQVYYFGILYGDTIWKLFLKLFDEKSVVYSKPLRKPCVVMKHQDDGVEVKKRRMVVLIKRTLCPSTQPSNR